MKLLDLILIAIILLVTCKLSAQPQEYVQNEVIIWLDKGVSKDHSPLLHHGLRPKRVLSKRLNIWLFEYPKGRQGESRSARNENLNRLNSMAGIRHCQDNHIVKSRAVTPNDTHFSNQWAPAIMQLTDVWDDYSTGGTTVNGKEVVIAVIDGGFDLGHEDLLFWKNTAEIANNGIDDDGNGYVDDFDGWNAFTHSGNLPSDTHGTHVSGIAGATGNNSQGISGVNWNLEIMPIAGSSGNEATVVEAYGYVLEMRALYNETNGSEGAYIVATNASFGVDNGDPLDFPIWCGIYDELGDVGILNCGATANANVNVDNVGDIPTTCGSDYLIAVTNTNSSDQKVTNAGFGPTNIDLGAPGDGIFSTTPNDNYGNLSGTSMATPQVTGIIALMYSSICEDFITAYDNNPSELALIIKDHLLEGADNMYPYGLKRLDSDPFLACLCI